MSLTTPVRESDEGRDARLLAAQLELLAGVVAGHTLPQALESLLRVVERVSTGGLLASIPLLDETGTRLLHGAAPSLPAHYNAAIHGVEIGPSVGSCGTAVYLRRQVIVFRLIDTLCESWGVREELDGKTVWARLRW